MIRISATLAILFCVALPLRAQNADGPIESPAADLPPPVSLTYVDGEVQYLTAGAAERANAQTMLNDGDGIRTARGRAELVFGDGSVLHLDEHTAIDLLSDHRLRVLGGRIVFRASAAAGAGYIIDTPAASIRVEDRGEYNLVVDGRNQAVEVSVARGVAEIDMSSERVVVRAGEEARLDRPGDRPLIRAFNSARLDAFERWSLTRYEGEALSPYSRGLPTELRAYGQTFDRYGRWDHVAPYGPVWYPTVDVGWRPYYNGSWRHTRYGWTWYSVDPWGWPTHHYGRWHVIGARWCWIPSRVWAPAWVSWAYAPGYVSWAPLGWDSRPVIPFYLRAGYGHPDRWRAWTVLPRGSLGRPGPIRPWVVDAYRAPHVARAAFVQQPVPAYRSPAYAIRRGDAGSDRAVPRGSFDRAVPRDRSPSGSVTGSATGAINPQGATGVKRDPRSAPQRGRTFEEQWGGMAVPRSTTPSAQPEPQRQEQESRGALRGTSGQPRAESRGGIRRRPDSPAYAPPASAAPPPDTRPKWEGPGPNDVNRSERRTDSARGSEVRSPRNERPERPTSSGSYSSPRSGGTSEPRAERAKPRGESGSGESSGRARGSNGGGENRGTASGGESRSGGRSGGVRRPQKN